MIARHRWVAGLTIKKNHSPSSELHRAKSWLFGLRPHLIEVFGVYR